MKDNKKILSTAVIGQVGDILSFNMFAYCHNNPVNMSDESGYLPKWMKTVVKAVKKTVTKVINKVKKIVTNKKVKVTTTITKAVAESANKMGEYYGNDRKTVGYATKYDPHHITPIEGSIKGYKSAAKAAKVANVIGKVCGVVEKVSFCTDVIGDLNSQNKLWNLSMTIGSTLLSAGAGKLIGLGTAGLCGFLGAPAMAGVVGGIIISAAAGYVIGEIADKLKKPDIIRSGGGYDLNYC